MFSFRVAFSLSVVVLSLALSAYTFAAELRTVALSGQPAPGIVAGATYRFFNNPPVINNVGHTAFEAFFNDANQSILGDGILSEASGTLDLIALEGTQAPDASAGTEFVNLSNPILNDNGKLVFEGFASIRNSGPLSAGLFTHELDNTRAVILTGNQAPGTSSGVVFDTLSSNARLNRAGDVASKYLIEGSGVNSSNSLGIWATRTDTLGLVVRNGIQAPGTPDGVQFNSLGNPALNDAGQLAFSGRLVGPTVNDTNNVAIWSGLPDNLQLVTRGGNQAPGTPNGVKFSIINDPTLNLAGQTAFQALITGDGVDSSNDRGIWSEGSGSLELIARSGEPAADVMDSDVVFSNFHPQPVINDSGQVAFRAYLAGDSIDTSRNNEGIWLGTEDELNLVARSGSQAPGTPSGAEFVHFDMPNLNANGQLAFTARLYWPSTPRGGTPMDGPGGVNSTNDTGLWATDMEGILHLIAREGDLLEVGPGDFRTISGLHFAGGTGNGDGKGSGFNNQGQIAFSAFFADGSSGVFVSNLVAVPEPSTLVLVLVSCVFGFLAR